MGHQITSRDTGVYNRPAWHGLLKVVGDFFTKEYALSKEGGNLGWLVGTEPCRQRIRLPDGTRKTVIIPGWQWTVRQDLPLDDPARYLAPVGRRYVPIQNHEAADMAEAIAQASGACFASAFSMKGGRRVVFLLKLPTEIKVGDDVIATYLMVCNAHDGSKVLEAVLTNVRVVCWNTYTLALEEASNVWRIRHTENATKRIDEAREVLGLVDKYNQRFAAVAGDLAQRKVNAAFVKAYIEALFPLNVKAKKPTRVLNARARVEALFNGEQKGADMECMRGTRWALLNAVSEYVDHYRTVRATGGRSKDEARADSLLFGSGAKLKERAFNLMVKADEMLAEVTAAN